MTFTPERYAASVAAQLRAERAARQLMVRDLAEASGVMEQSLLRYLNGKREVPVPVLYQIVNGLGLGMGEFIARVEQRLDEEV